MLFRLEEEFEGELDTKAYDLALAILGQLAGRDRRVLTALKSLRSARFVKAGKPSTLELESLRPKPTAQPPLIKADFDIQSRRVDLPDLNIHDGMGLNKYTATPTEPKLPEISLGIESPLAHAYIGVPQTANVAPLVANASPEPEQSMPAPMSPVIPRTTVQVISTIGPQTTADAFDENAHEYQSFLSAEGKRRATPISESWWNAPVIDVAQVTKKGLGQVELRVIKASTPIYAVRLLGEAPVAFKSLNAASNYVWCRQNNYSDMDAWYAVNKSRPPVGAGWGFWGKRGNALPLHVHI